MQDQSVGQVADDRAANVAQVTELLDSCLGVVSQASTRGLPVAADGSNNVAPVSEAQLDPVGLGLEEAWVEK